MTVAVYKYLHGLRQCFVHAARLFVCSLPPKNQVIGRFLLKLLDNFKNQSVLCNFLGIESLRDVSTVNSGYVLIL